MLPGQAPCRLRRAGVDVTDRDRAWARIHAATPAGWFVGRPGYDPGRQQWTQYAFDPSERPRVGLRSREWTAVGMTELDVLEEMGRCLEEIKQGRVPR